METELNIANILKDKPSGTKLYADAFGELKFVKVDKVDTIYTRTKEGMFYSFYNDGKYNKNGEPILVPSKEMRNWSKFAWKKGDILVSDDSKSHVIFSRWYADNYTSFFGKHYLNNENKNTLYYEVFICTTETYSLEDKNAAKAYINVIEERLGGKLNLETLEIEKQPKKKKVIDLKLKWTPKPFDKIVAFEELGGEWVCDMFSHYSKNYEDKEIIVAIGGCTYFKALPFNEKTAKLIGTTKEWKE